MTTPAAVWDWLTRGHDRTLLAATGGLLVFGLVLSLAASPPTAARLDLDGAFHLSLRHAGFAAATLLVLTACAQSDARIVRRIAVAVFVVSIFALIAVALAGVEKKGARRWLELGALSLQPSEFAKPAVIILCAWMLAERMKHPAFPGLGLSAGLLAAFAVLVAPQPDIGQTALTALVVLALVCLARVNWRWIVGALFVGALSGLGAYALFDHVRGRVDAYLHAEVVANSQVGLALGALANGGLFGQGPGEGEVKMDLPDAHADFIFAVAAEELGLIGVFGLMALYAVITWVGLQRAARLIDPFAQLAATGLFLLLALQALVHIGVNVALTPAKGMTLPLVSYGGSSLIASGMTLGLALALVRLRPGAFLHDRTSG